MTDDRVRKQPEAPAREAQAQTAAPRNANRSTRAVVSPAHSVERAPAPGEVGIDPVAVSGNNPSIAVEWQPVDLVTNRSCSCNIRADAQHALTVTIEQGHYRRTLVGVGNVDVPAIPLGTNGTSGRLTARDDVTGASAEFTWQWQPLGGAAGGEARVSARGVAGLFSKFFGTKAQTEAASSLAHGSGSSFDGVWHHHRPPWDPFALKIAGRVGLCVVTNAPEFFQPGDTVLYIDELTEYSFVGRVIYTDGKFRTINATLQDVDHIFYTLANPDDYAENNVTFTRR